jgi:predicted tellurium resistance membrane protein TerC
MPPFFSLETFGSILTLSALETVLGIDNVIFLSILVSKMPRSQQTAGRRLGLILALGMRICLLLTLTWLASLTATLFSVASHPISGRDLVLIIGGGFLIFKSTWEIFGDAEPGNEPKEEPQTLSVEESRKKSKNFVFALIQIAVMDIVFSLDSVITAVGLAPQLSVILVAMFISMLLMLGFAKFIGDYVEKHPSMKILALSFLIMIGTILVAEGGGQHINKGYIYAAMGFAVTVELLNIWLRQRSSKGEGEEKAPEIVKTERELELEAQLAASNKRVAELETQLGHHKLSLQLTRRPWRAPGW